MNGPRSAQVQRLPLVLLGGLTAVSFGGPFGLGWVLAGGSGRGWPPDRPVEWVALFGVVGLAILLLTMVLALNLANLRAMKAESQASGAQARDVP